MAEVKEVPISFKLTKDMKKVLKGWDKKVAAFAKNKGGREGNVMINEGTILYFPAGPNPRAYLKAEASLIARKTTGANGVVWRWGHTLEDGWHGVVVSKADVMRALGGGPFATLAEASVAGLPGDLEAPPLSELIEALLADRLGFAWVEETRLGPSPDEKYVMGLKNLQWNVDIPLPQGIERTIEVMEQGLTKENEINAVLHPNVGDSSAIVAMGIAPLH